MYYARVDINLMIENIIQIQIGITINVDASAKIRKKNIVCAKKIAFGILVHILVKNDKYLEIVTGDSVITCDEIIEGNKTVPTGAVTIKIFKQKLFQKILREKR